MPRWICPRCQSVHPDLSMNCSCPATSTTYAGSADCDNCKALCAELDATKAQRDAMIVVAKLHIATAKERILCCSIRPAHKYQGIVDACEEILAAGEAVKEE